MATSIDEKLCLGKFVFFGDRKRNAAYNHFVSINLDLFLADRDPRRRRRSTTTKILDTEGTGPSLTEVGRGTWAKMCFVHMCSYIATKLL